MNCITRYELKFGDIVIPARTKCRIVNREGRFTPNAPGVLIDIVVDNNDLKKGYTENENKVIKFRNNVNNANLTGILISTNTESVYINANHRMYYDYRISDWKLERIFGKDKVPENLITNDCGWKDAELFKVIEYLDEEFAEWVSINCEFVEVTQEDIDNGDVSPAFDVGSSVLNDRGLEDFKNKSMEYKRKLEKATGFTYEFKGGLIWE